MFVFHSSSACFDGACVRALGLKGRERSRSLLAPAAGKPAVFAGGSSHPVGGPEVRRDLFKSLLLASSGIFLRSVQPQGTIHSARPARPLLVSFLPPLLPVRLPTSDHGHSTRI